MMRWMPLGFKNFLASIGILGGVEGTWLQPKGVFGNVHESQESSHILSRRITRAQPIDAATAEQEVRGGALFIEIGSVQDAVSGAIDFDEGTRGEEGFRATAQDDDHIGNGGLAGLQAGRGELGWGKVAPLEGTRQPGGCPAVAENKQDDEGKDQDQALPADSLVEKEGEQDEQDDKTEGVNQGGEEFREKYVHALLQESYSGSWMLTRRSSTGQVRQEVDGGGRKNSPGKGRKPIDPGRLRSRAAAALQAPGETGQRAAAGQSTSDRPVHRREPGKAPA